MTVSTVQRSRVYDLNGFQDCFCFAAGLLLRSNAVSPDARLEDRACLLAASALGSRDSFSFFEGGGGVCEGRDLFLPSAERGGADGRGEVVVS